MRFLAMLSVVASLAACASPTDAPLTPEALVSRLREGGLVLYMRHAQTDPLQKEGPRADFADCSWQRTLVDAGRAQARAIGEAIRKLELPIKTVIASPMCRTMETARLMHGEARAERALLGRATPEGKLDVEPIKDFWRRPVAKGELVAIVGHESADLGFKPILAEGETAVIEPRGDGYRIVDRIPAARWAELAGAR